MFGTNTRLIKNESIINICSDKVSAKNLKRSHLCNDMLII